MITPDNLSIKALASALTEIPNSRIELQPHGLVFSSNDRQCHIAIVGPEIILLSPSVVSLALLPTRVDRLELSNEINADLALGIDSYLSEDGDLILRHTLSVSENLSERQFAVLVLEFQVKCVICDAGIKKKIPH